MQTTASSAGRRQIHLRRIFCTAYARDDGLWDIEGRLIDTKPEAVDMPDHRVEAGEAIHDMLVCLTIDRGFTIRAAWARTSASPYPVCGAINESYAQLVGLRIEAGFTQKIKRLFRATLGCSHLTELLPPMATTAFQALWNQPAGDQGGLTGEALSLGGCHALRLDGDVVRVLFPASYRPPAAQP